MQLYRVIEFPVQHRLRTGQGLVSKARAKGGHDFLKLCLCSKLGPVTKSVDQRKSSWSKDSKGGIRGNLHLLSNHTLQSQFNFEISVLCQSSVERWFERTDGQHVDRLLMAVSISTGPLTETSLFTFSGGRFFGPWHWKAWSYCNKNRQRNNAALCASFRGSFFAFKLSWCRNFAVHWSNGFNGCNEEHGGQLVPQRD